VLFSLWLVVVAIVITAIARVISGVPMAAASMAMQLHVPLETVSAKVARKEARGKMATFDVSH